LETNQNIGINLYNNTKHILKTILGYTVFALLIALGNYFSTSRWMGINEGGYLKNFEKLDI